MDLDDDSDDSSSPETLDQFREKWQEELVQTKKQQRNQTSNQLYNGNFVDKNNQQAETLFMQGVELEKKGKVFEAMRLYRRAVHIDRDIEFKMYETLKATTQANKTVEADKNVNARSVDPADDEDLSGVDLVARFQATIINGNGSLFRRENADKGVIVTDGLHISDLPMEIILYILRWVVSSNLDLRALEQCSMVSKGFYLCARDSEIWKQACFTVWGRTVGMLKTETNFSSWRHMFIERPRVWFNGCYISKTSYLRYGERSFQDQFYRPVHMVEYYRYIRFFSDSTVVLMTSADEPAQIVGKLQNGKHRNDVLTGDYKFSDDMVTIIVRKNKTKEHSQMDKMRGGYNRESPSFCLQFLMSYTKKRRWPQLEWKKYSIIQKQNKYEELMTDFELTPSKYPTMIFSRVKSYDAQSLQRL